MATATTDKKQSKAKKAASVEQVTEESKALVESLLEEFGGMFARFDQMEAEIKGFQSSEKDALKAAAREMQEEDQLAQMAIDAERKAKQEEEEENMGRLRKGARRIGRMLPDNRRERNMFVGGYLLGTSTSSVVAPIAIVGASLAKARVIING